MAAPSACCWRPCRASRWRSWGRRPPAATPLSLCCGRRGADPGGLAGRCEPSDRPGLHPRMHREAAGQRTGARPLFPPLAREQAEFPAAWAGTSGALPAGAPVLAGYLDGTPVGAVAFDDGREAERGCGWIPLLAVAEPWRRRGYGVQLIGQAVMHYRPMGRDRLRLPTPETEAAAGFTGSLAFLRRRTGRRGKSSSDMTRSFWAHNSSILNRQGRSECSGPACAFIPGGGRCPGSGGRSYPRRRGPANTRWGPPPGPGPSGSPQESPRSHRESPRHVRLQGIDILLRSGLPKKARGTVNASPTSAGEGATAAKPAAETSPNTGCIRKPA